MDEKNKTVAEQITEKRIENIRKMHERIQMMNHENAYLEWIETMPDCPNDPDDFEWFAEDDEEYEGLVAEFLRILTEYGKYGFVKG